MVIMVNRVKIKEQMKQRMNEDYRIGKDINNNIKKECK